jgi:hypothetical protein
MPEFKCSIFSGKRACDEISPSSLNIHSFQYVRLCGGASRIYRAPRIGSYSSNIPVVCAFHGFFVHHGITVLDLYPGYYVNFIFRDIPLV